MRKIVLLSVAVFCLLSVGLTARAQQADHKPDAAVNRNAAIDVAAVYGSGSFSEAALAQAIVAAGSAPTRLFLRSGEWSVTSSLVIPPNISIEMAKGATFTKTRAGKLTIKGVLIADSQCFKGFADGEIRLKSAKPEWFGVTGADDDVAIQHAAFAADRVVFEDGKTYVLGSHILIKKSIVLEGKAILDGSATASGAILTIQGSDSETSATLSAAGVKDANKIIVASTSGFSVGDMIMLRSTEDWSETAASADDNHRYKKGEIAFIKSVDNATSLTLTEPLKDNYSITGQTVTVTKLNKINKPLVDGLRIMGGGAGKGHLGLIICYATEPVIRNVEVSKCEIEGIGFGYTDHGTINHCRVSGANKNGTGYGYAFDNMAQNCAIIDSYSEDHRHGFTTGSYYPVWDYQLINFVARNAASTVTAGAGINTHKNSRGGQFINTEVDGAYIGIGLAGARNIVMGGQVRNCTYACVYLQDDAALNTTIMGVQGRSSRYGINVAAFTGESVPQVHIESCDLTGEGDSPYYGIVLSVAGIVRNNTITGFATALRQNAGTGSVFEGNKLSGYANAITDIEKGSTFRDNYLDDK